MPFLSLRPEATSRGRPRRRMVRRAGLRVRPRSSQVGYGPNVAQDGPLRGSDVTDHVTAPVQFERLTMTDSPAKSRCQLPLPLMYATPSVAPRPDRIDNEVPADLDVHLVLDNYGTHKTPATQRWLLRHLRFHLHFTPTYSSWINQVERWFADLTEKQIRRGTHRSTRALEDAIRLYVTLNNENPKPFVWLKTADEILSSIARFCLRTSETGH
jgi:transposase